MLEIDRLQTDVGKLEDRNRSLMVTAKTKDEEVETIKRALAEKMAALKKKDEEVETIKRLLAKIQSQTPSEMYARWAENRRNARDELKNAREDKQKAEKEINKKNETTKKTWTGFVLRILGALVLMYIFFQVFVSRH